MKIALLAQRGSWYARDLKRAAAARGHRAAASSFPSWLDRWAVRERKRVFGGGERDSLSFDAAIVRTMPPGSLEQVVYRMDALWRLAAAGVVVLNPPKAVECAVDKYLALVRLESRGLTVPPTVVCENAEAALEAMARLGGDVVVKPIFGSEGGGIVRVSDPDLALCTFRTLERLHCVLYVQQFIENEGFDVRVLVLDGRVLLAMRRRANGDFRTNVSCRGIPEVACRHGGGNRSRTGAAEATGARFAGIDLLYGRDGTCYVIEVSASWLGAFQRVTGLDVASAVIASLER